jgi:predicted lysophospholipase L1 biosynthesis ABC-type transport system permease subunit
MNNNDLLDDDFHEQMQREQRYAAFVGLSFLILSFFTVVFTVYFFLSAAGVVPPMDLIPWIPYI